MADLAGSVSKLAGAATGIFGDLAEKKQKLADTTAMAEATMRAELDMDSIMTSIKGSRESEANAPDVYSAKLKEAEKGWMKGLRPEQQFQLRRELTPRVITGMKNARDLQNKVQIDDAKTTMSDAKEMLVKKAYRLDLPDDQAFEGVYTITSTGGEPDAEGRSEGVVTTREYNGSYPRYLGELVDSTLISREDATKELRDTTRTMAYGRLERMIVSDNPRTVQRAVDLLKAEEADPKSTYAYDIAPERRNGALKEAQTRLVTLENTAREVTDRNRKDIDEAVKRTEEAEITTMVADILKGDKKVSIMDVDRMRSNNSILARDRSTYEHLDMLIKKGSEGVTDQRAYARLWDRAMTGQLTARDVLPHVGNGLSRKDAEHLVTVSTSRSITDDDFFKTGYRDVENAVRPPVGVIDEARQSRWAEASREYYDRAKKLIDANEREKIPQMARQLSDEWRNKAPANSVKGPVHTPRYGTKDETFSAFATQYGPNVTTWPEAGRKEFDRQMWMHEQISPTPVPGIPGSDPQRKTESAKPQKPVSKTPSPF